MTTDNVYFYLQNRLIRLKSSPRWDRFNIGENEGLDDFWAEFLKSCDGAVVRHEGRALAFQAIGEHPEVKVLKISFTSSLTLELVSLSLSLSLSLYLSLSHNTHTHTHTHTHTNTHTQTTTMANISENRSWLTRFQCYAAFWLAEPLPKYTLGTTVDRVFMQTERKRWLIQVAWWADRDRRDQCMGF